MTQAAIKIPKVTDKRGCQYAPLQVQILRAQERTRVASSEAEFKSRGAFSAMFSVIRFFQLQPHFFANITSLLQSSMARALLFENFFKVGTSAATYSPKALLALTLNPRPRRQATPNFY